jgi:hypothetical protein
MSGDRMQASRFELKYVISEQKAQRVRHYVSSFLDLDENCAGRPDLSYAVHSLYVDSDEMKTYWDTINGSKNRFKLRIRYYNDDAEAPVFLEIKRRMNNCIHKQRVAVRREAVKMILRGQLPPPALVLARHARHLLALQNFCRAVQQMQARPKMHIAYLREAYLPKTDNSARVTMDRQVLSEPNPTGRLSTQMMKPLLVWGRAVVLELKFTDRYPNWFRDLVQVFELRQCGAAKYADGVTLLSGHLPQHRRMPQPGQGLHWPLKREVIDHHKASLIQRLTGGGGRQHPGRDLSGLETNEEGISTEPA